MCPQKEKKGSLSRGSRDRLANLAVKSSQSVGDNRECGMVWIVMNNTGLGLQGLLLNSRASSQNVIISLAILRPIMVSL